LVTPPPVAVTVRVEVPAPTVEAAERVNVLLPLPGDAMLVGAKLPLTPVGSPLIDKATAALNPFTRAVVNVMGIEPPGATLAFVALGVSVKLGGGRIVRLKVRVLVVPPPTAAGVKV